MHYWHDKKLKDSHILGYEPDWRAGIIVNYNLDLTKKFGCFLFYQNNQNKASYLPYLCNQQCAYLILF